MGHLASVVVAVFLLSSPALAQVPDVSPPPLLNDPTPAPAPAPEAAFIEAIDRKLLVFRQEGFGLQLANREKSVGIGSLFWDNELEAMFGSVPAASTLFQEARAKTFVASLLTLGGFIGVAGSVAVLVVFLLAPLPSLPLLVAAMVLDLAALVVTLISIPFRMRAQAGLYEAVEAHNRGLLRLPFPTPIAPAPGPVVLRF